MDELIPITDFDKRYFPDVSEDEKINYIMHSNDFERISMKFEQVQSYLLIPQKSPPAVQGQMRCVNLILSLATNPDLIPKPSQISTTSFNKLFPWFVNLHKNLLYDFAKKGEELYNVSDYPSIQELSQLRQYEKVLGNRTMPHPDSIKQLLVQAFKDYATIYHEYHTNLSNPRMLETSDWQKLEKAAHTLALDIACIKPFNDGSNRIARLVENLVRLNTGLKFKIFDDKQKFLNEVWEHQDSKYKIS